jgi:hypothetical protein
MRRIYLELVAVRMTGKSQHFERLIEDPQGYTRRNLKSREPGLQITDSLFDFFVVLEVAGCQMALQA